MVELWKREPVGLLLYGYVFLVVGLAFYFIEVTDRAPLWLRIMVIAGFISTPIGMIRVHRAAFKLTKERRSEDFARTPAPWD